jgi:hypothetical protein
VATDSGDREHGVAPEGGKSFTLGTGDSGVQVSPSLH